MTWQDKLRSDTDVNKSDIMNVSQEQNNDVN